MNNLEKIQKGMKVFQILSKIIFVFACVGVVLGTIAAILVATDVATAENGYLTFISVTTEMSKGQLVGTLTLVATTLLFSGVITGFVCHYFSAELKEGTPFTNAGAVRIRNLGIVMIAISIVSLIITEGINHIFNLPNEWTHYDDVGSIALGVCLILIAMVVRYGAELELKSREK